MTQVENSSQYRGRIARRWTLTRPSTRTVEEHIGSFGSRMFTVSIRRPEKRHRYHLDGDVLFLSVGMEVLP